MNKKILVISILAVLMLVAISFSTAVSSNTTTTVKKKESPLFDIRARRAINEKFGEIIENIKTKYIGERLFFMPFTRIKFIERFQAPTDSPFVNTCGGTICWACTLQKYCP